MNELFTLIDERINKKLRDSPCIVPIPCTILKVYDNQTAKVKVVSTNSEYVLPNWSGSDIVAGEQAQIFCKGTSLSANTSYIGAVLNKNNGGGSVAFNSVSGEVITAELSNNEELLSYMTVINYSNSVILSVNLTFNGDASNAGNGTISVYVDETEQTYTPIFNVGANGYETLSFSLPLNLTIGSHYIEVKGTGSYAELISGCVFAFGNIGSYYPTDENDYIYIIEDGEATIVQYIGNSICPLVPTKLEGATVTTIASGAFTNTDVVDVCIPEGITTIE